MSAAATPRRSPTWILPVAVALLASASSVRASDGSEPARRRGTSEFWRNVREPGYLRARALLTQGRAILSILDRPTEMGAHERNAVIERALHRFELARRLAPNDAEIALVLAHATAMWEQPSVGGPPARLDELAIERFLAVREADPELVPERVAFQLGILHTRQERFAEATAEYERSIAYDLSPDPAAWMNLAEVTMLAGDLPRAVQRYERSVEVSRQVGDPGALPLFGLAVALDRLGEHRQARETAREALLAGGGTTDILRSPGVFFVPAHEIHWYDGLAAEARAEDPSVPDAERADARRRARESFVAFLEAGGRRSRWAEQAETHVARLSRAPAAGDRRPPPRRRGRARAGAEF